MCTKGGWVRILKYYHIAVSPEVKIANFWGCYPRCNQANRSGPAVLPLPCCLSNSPFTPVATLIQEIGDI